MNGASALSSSLKQNAFLVESIHAWCKQLPAALKPVICIGVSLTGVSHHMSCLPLSLSHILYLFAERKQIRIFTLEMMGVR